jgi:transposase InsO family protein
LATSAHAAARLESDFTYLEAAEGRLFLAFTLDACTRRCVAHHCRPEMRGDLTTTTLALAVHRQAPPPGLLHHRDRGVQYAAAAFAQLAGAHGITLRMSRTANPYDHALAESFVATLKTECFGDAIPPTRATAELMAFDYIETFYNRRRHGSLGYRSPLVFEKQIFPPKQKPPTSTTYQKSKPRFRGKIIHPMVSRVIHKTCGVANLDFLFLKFRQESLQR